MATDNGWNEWARHVLAELLRLSICDEKQREQLNQIDVKLAQLAVKAGIWGLLGGAIPISIALLVGLLK